MKSNRVNPQGAFNSANAARYIDVSRSAWYAYWQHFIPVSLLPGSSGKTVKRYRKERLDEFLKEHEVFPGDPRHPGNPLSQYNYFATGIPVESNREIS